MNLKDFCIAYPDELPEICKKAGTSTVYVRHIAAGYRYPSRDLALRLEQASGGRMTRMELLYPDTVEVA